MDETLREYGATDVLPLARRIASCPLVARSRGPTGDLEQCHDVVVLGNNPTHARYVRAPEPWIGHLGIARMLFVSSNPNGLDGSQEAKEASRTDDDSILRETEFAFDEMDGRREIPIADYATGKHMTSWRGAYACALQVFGEAVSAGHDYAQTEVVHCGSAKQAGVQPALPVCTALYLRPVLRAAKRARVIVSVGRWAEIAFRDVLRIETSERIAQPGMVEGIRRVVLFVAHPAAREVDASAKRLSATQVTAARVSLGLA